MVNRITYEPITELYPHEIAVCGSNLAGRHGAGFAKFCLNNFGAIYGKGFGPQGQCYMIPTKDHNIKTLPLSDIALYVKVFIEYARLNPNLIFKVSSIGTGYARITVNDIAPLFKDVIDIKNIHLPIAFWDILNNE